MLLLPTRVCALFFAVSLSGVGCGLEQGGLALDVATGRDPSEGVLDARTRTHADAGTDASSSAHEPTPLTRDSEAASPAAASDAAMDGCRFEGLFALRIEAQVRWAGTTLLDIVPIVVPGRGLVRVVALVGLGKRGAAGSALIRACGAEVPDFSASVGERYGVSFPDQVWENTEQRWLTDVSNECDQPGCAFATSFVTVQLGIGIADRAAWPGPRDPLDEKTLRDDDRDGLPGILLRARGPKDPGGAGYTHPPASALLLQRVSEMQLAIRLGAQISGVRASCDAHQGAGNANTVSLDTRALGCRLDSGLPCSVEQLGFVDDNLPVWNVDSVTWQTQRVSDAAGCAEARAAVR